MNDHLLIVKTGSELVPPHFYGKVACDNFISKAVLSLVGVEAFENIYNQCQVEPDNLSDKALENNLCQIISIDALRLKKQPETQNYPQIVQGLWLNFMLLTLELRLSVKKRNGY